MRNRLTLTVIFTTLLSGCCTLLNICPDTGDSRNAWNNVLQHCANSDLNSQTILYFGPSNSLGPGSIWRKASDGGYRLGYELKDILGMPADNTLIVKGDPVGCNGSTSSTSDFGASLNFDGNSLPLTASLQADIKSAKNVQAEATSISWDLIKEGPYTAGISQLPAGNAVRSYIGSDDKLVMYRALRVTGYSAKIDFNQADVAGLQAKYAGPQLGGALGGGLTANWAANGTLTITSPSEFYIAGEIVPYKTTGFASPEAALSARKVQVGNHATGKKE